MENQFNPGDSVLVEYQYGKTYTGKVLWSETFLGLYWVTVRPDDSKYIFTFGSSRDMENGYKSYIANHKILGQVSQIC